LCCLDRQNRLNEIDFSSKRIVQLTLTNTEKMMEYDHGGVTRIRKIILKNHLKQIDQYHDLFFGIYALIELEELVIFSDFSNSLRYICGTKLNEDNCKFICDYINAAYRNPKECYDLFCCFNDEYEETITDLGAQNYLIRNLDYKKVDFHSMSIEYKEEVTQYISAAMELDNAQNCIEYLRMTNTLIPSIERIISDSGLTDEYIELINEIDCPTEQTINWISNQDDIFSLSHNTTSELLIKGFFKEYLFGKTLNDGRLNFDPNLFAISIYIEAYNSSDSMFDIMHGNREFIKFLLDEKEFADFTLKRLRPIYVLRQPFYFVKHMFERLDADQIVEYLEIFPHLDTDDDSKAFLDFIKLPEITAKLNSKKSRSLAREKIWTPGDRQKFTKFMKKKYPD
jgi:hypothetical protein